MRLRPRAGHLPRQAARNPQLARARLYVITPDASPERVVEVATGAQRGGADVVQLRHKTLPRGELLELARTLRRVITTALFVVNGQASASGDINLAPSKLLALSVREHWRGLAQKALPQRVR